MNRGGIRANHKCVGWLDSPRWIGRTGSAANQGKLAGKVPDLRKVEDLTGR